MVVKINGKPEETQASVVMDLLKGKGIDPQMVAVELNDAMVDREHLATTPIKEGDRLEFLFYMGGGR